MERGTDDPNKTVINIRTSKAIDTPGQSVNTQPYAPKQNAASNVYVRNSFSEKSPRTLPETLTGNDSARSFPAEQTRRFSDGANVNGVFNNPQQVPHYENVKRNDGRGGVNAVSNKFTPAPDNKFNPAAATKFTPAAANKVTHETNATSEGDKERDNGRRQSRKSGVYVLPPHPKFSQRSDDGQNWRNERETAGYKDGQVGNPIPQRTSPTGPRVKIVAPHDKNLAESDSGVERSTPFPLCHPSSSQPNPLTNTVIVEVEENSDSAANNNTGTNHNGEDEEKDDEEDDDYDYKSSRFLSQLHPVYEKKPGAMKGARRISHDGGVLRGARRISHHNRKTSVGTESNSSNVVPSHKGSMVMIDQIPQIIQDSLQSYFLPPDRRRSSMLEQGYDLEGQGQGPGLGRSPRISIFSMHSRRGSELSDVSFWDPQESLPHADHYRYSLDQDGYRARPTIYQLREEPESPTKSTFTLGDDLEDDKETEEGPKTAPDSQKNGWIQGVLVRCLLNIFGVMLFLRLTWITGQAGIGLASVIVLLAAMVTTLTTMSMAAICTNGEVKGGGAYYMISRSLGPEFGGAIGVIFSLANAVAAALYVVGFAETVRDLVKDNGAVITGDAVHDVRVIGVGVTVLLLGVVMIGLDFETKAQLVLLVILIISIVNFFVGTFIPPSEDKRRLGFVGYDEKVFLQNIGPDFRKYHGVDYSFFTVFAIFFPAATGILAGANISGDLKNPSTAIPKGTFLAILLTTIVYLAIIWITGSCMLRDAIGDATTIATNVTLTLDDIRHCGDNTTCEYGMHNTHGIMSVASAFEPLIYAGIFSATLSSALASLVSAPKVFQALGKDKLFPFIGFFAKGYGKNGEPRRGYFLTFIICLGMTCIGSLDIIAPIISNFFLMAYALINFSCFDAAFANSPGFRPSFRLYNKWSSLVGALLCVAIMFMVSWWAALVTVIVVTGLFIYIKHRKPDVNWGSSGQAHAYNDALKTTLKLVDIDEHVKNFRPQILVLTGYPRNRPALVDFAASITKRQSLLLCAQVFQGDMQRHLRHLRSTAAYRWFRNRNVRAFYTSCAAPTVRHGTQLLLQSQGLGKLRPNMLLMGFKNRWQMVDPRSVHNYVGIIHDAFDLNYGVGILRLSGGLDTHKVSDFLLDATDDSLDDLEHDSIDEDVSDEEEDKTVYEANKRKVSTIFSEKPDSPSSTFGNIALQEFRQKSERGVVNGGYYDEEDEDEEEEEEEEEEEKEKEQTNNSKNTEKIDSAAAGTAPKDTADNKTKENVNNEKTKDGPANGPKGSPKMLQSVLSQVDSVSDATIANHFRGKHNGTIDVWWLFDDGGLGLLLPYILSSRKQWRECKLRVFCAGTKRSNLDEDQRRMAVLLSKFRIEYSDITIFPDLRKRPRRSTYTEFEELICRWRLRPGETQDDYPWKISNADLASHKQKIYMQLKIREKLLENSMGASLVVVTLPVPRKFCPAGLYMAWLDTLTRDLPPTLLLRGNQQSVLTYFS
ncbi:solute carrier family 12 member 3-like [Littorina saxatilis]|uniref:Solute carrier family 12 member 2 n=1 Tax=Littorina saxatilis TaxID=31220 RepID=A0AAN9GP51_9CAEN